MVLIKTAKQAILDHIKDGDTVTVGGFAGGLVHPEQITSALEELALEGKAPKDLTLVYAAGQGDGKDKGINHFGAVEGVVSTVIGGHWGLSPKVCQLALDNKVAGYNLPQGVIAQLFRDIAAGKPGVITHVGLKTFVDPRLQGGKLNKKAEERGEIVELINLKGEEKLFYPSFPINVSILRASFADTHGNCTFEHECCLADTVAQAQAAKNSGGIVIVQVEKIVEFGSLDHRLVRLPGIYVDVLVEADKTNHHQSYGTEYNPAFSGEIRVPLSSIKPLSMNERKIIARRAAMELVPNSVTNLGIGMPEGVSAVAAEEGIQGMVLTTECGIIGGVPAGGSDFGASVNYDCMVDQSVQFDFYDGGGLDVAFLGLAQMDKHGNINVSKFGPKIAGCGGFINISQNAKKVVYCGTFTAGGLKTEIKDNKLLILNEGKFKKFIDEVEQVTFSGEYAQEIGQEVIYITERAVFKLTQEGVELAEIAPGVDIEKDVLAHMEFKPIIKNVQLMDSRIFREEKMNLINI